MKNISTESGFVLLMFALGATGLALHFYGFRKLGVTLVAMAIFIAFFGVAKNVAALFAQLFMKKK